MKDEEGLLVLGCDLRGVEGSFENECVHELGKVS